MKIACIVPIFNLAEDSLLESNHRKALERLQEGNVDIYTSRAVVYDPIDDDSGLTIQAPSVLWLKESLINRAISKLYQRYDAVAWVDSGIFLTPGWVDRVKFALIRNDMVQCYHQGTWLDKKGIYSSHRWGFVYWQSASPDLPKNRKPLKASVGGAWAAKSEVFSTIRLYDRAVVGGGDTWAINGFMNVNTPEALVTQHLTIEHRYHVCQWIKQARRLSLKVGWIEGSYYHLWHTPQEYRRHSTRHKILHQHGYDPAHHTKINDLGILEWSNTAPIMLVEDVKQFIFGRSASLGAHR